MLIKPDFKSIQFRKAANIDLGLEIESSQKQERRKERREGEREKK